jgi:hypothetical protein
MNNRTLGAVGIVCAPALLAGMFIQSQEQSPVVMGVTSMIFMLGSFASHVGLWRAAATGTRWGRAPLVIQLILVAMAFVFGVFEATGVLSENNPLFIATDIAWPVSMIWMNVVGIAALVARRLPVPQRFAPLVCGTSLPITMAITVLGGVGIDEQLSGYIFFTMLAVFWALLGLAVMHSERAAAPRLAAQPTAA